jgi:hypothetical protein
MPSQGIKWLSQGEACLSDVCVLSSFRTFVGAAAAYVWLSCYVSCSDFRSMPSRLLRTSVDRSDEAFLGCCADNQISIYLPSNPYFKPDSFLSHPLHPSPPRSHRPSAPPAPCLLVFHSVSGTRPCSMQRPQTFSPFRSSSSFSADRLALACPRHQRPAFVLGSHAEGEEPKWAALRRRYDCLSSGCEETS